MQNGAPMELEPGGLAKGQKGGVGRSVSDQKMLPHGKLVSY